MVAAIPGGGGTALAVAGDLSTAEAGPEVVRAAVRGWAGSTLINNAGAILSRQPSAS